MTTNPTEELDRLEMHMELEIAKGKKVVSDFAEKLGQNTHDPLHMFEWSRETFKGSATVSVYVMYLEILKGARKNRGDEEAMEGFKQVLTRETLRAAHNPMNSTSPCANFAHICKAEAMAGLLSDIECYLY